MQFEVNLESLLGALEIVKGIVDRRQTIPILSHILFTLSGHELTLIATDNEITVQKRMNVESVQEEGSATVPARKLIDICNHLPPASVLFFQQDVKSGRLVLRVDNQDKSYFSLVSLPPSDFPNFEYHAAQLQITLPKETLSALIESTYFAVAEQDVRYYLNGMLWDIKTDAFHTVATDGHRLAKSTFLFSTPQAMQVIVPRKTLQELSRLFKKPEKYLVELTLAMGQLSVKTPEYTLASRLIDANFPDYSRLIVAGEAIARVDRDQLKDSLSRMRVLLNDRYPGIRLSFSCNLLQLSVRNLEQEEAAEQFTIDYKPAVIDEIFAIAFNNEYLMDVLNVLPSGLIEFQFTPSMPNKSILLQHTKKRDNVYIIMPIRL